MHEDVSYIRLLNMSLLVKAHESSSLGVEVHTMRLLNERLMGGLVVFRLGRGGSE